MIFLLIRQKQPGIIPANHVTKTRRPRVGECTRNHWYPWRRKPGAPRLPISHLGRSRKPNGSLSRNLDLALAGARRGWVKWEELEEKEGDLGGGGPGWGGAGGG